MSVITGKDEVIRMKSEDLLVKAMDVLIDDIKKLREDCNENKNSSLYRENVWKKVRDIQRILHNR